MIQQKYQYNCQQNDRDCDEPNSAALDISCNTDAILLKNLSLNDAGKQQYHHRRIKS